MHVCLSLPNIHNKLHNYTQFCNAQHKLSTCMCNKAKNVIINFDVYNQAITMNSWEAAHLGSTLNFSLVPGTWVSG